MTQLLPSFKSVSFPRKIRRSSHICYFMPMGSQQTTISTCLHLSLRPLQNLDMADVINVIVTYNKTKRIISYQKDGSQMCRDFAIFFCTSSLMCYQARSRQLKSSFYSAMTKWVRKTTRNFKITINLMIKRDSEHSYGKRKR